MPERSALTSPGDLVDRLLADPPMIHRWESGEPVLWAASERMLRFLDGVVRPGDRTLETGAGLSTLLFAAKGCHHTAVVPDPEQAERIVTWCEANDVSTERLRFELEPSEAVLPGLAPEPLDLVLIDGAHGFPAPFIDWYYAGRRVRVGGTVVVDDTDIWTGAVLRDFLDGEEQWSVTAREPFDFAAARRVAEGPVGDWVDQPFVLRRSWTANSSSPIRRASRVTYRIRIAAELARRRRWSELGGKVARVARR